jgi:hypothetical protein
MKRSRKWTAGSLLSVAALGSLLPLRAADPAPAVVPGAPVLSMAKQQSIFSVHGPNTKLKRLCWFR